VVRGAVGEQLKSTVGPDPEVNQNGGVQTCRGGLGAKHDRVNRSQGGGKPKSERKIRGVRKEKPPIRKRSKTKEFLGILEMVQRSCSGQKGEPTS